jgi:class 3 adenylate cyclase/tetratricopeptide (TPR) repeat protein
MDSASRSVRQWLTALDLAQYLPHFVAQDIDGAVLALLTDGDLRELGIASMGHRKRLLKAIAESVRAGDLLTPALAQDLPMSRPETDVTSAPSAASAPEPERRQLTVIFCDLVDSTALSTRLDPEDLRQVVRRYHRLASSVIERFGGFPAQFMGDGVMAFFGYPAAHEDDAERAVRAGLALVAELSADEMAVGAPIAVRVGIATGEVVVGGTGAPGCALANTAVGETPHLAARIQAIGAPGSVLIAGSTRRLVTGTFEYREPGQRALSGAGDLVVVSEVLRVSGAASRFEARNGTALAPLVGREEDMAFLRERWRLACRAKGQVVVVCADPGVGKSRIAAALREELDARQTQVLQYFCSPYHAESPLHPFVEPLARACAGAPADDTAARIAVLAGLLGVETTQSPQDLGLLFEILSLGASASVEPFEGGPQQKKARLFDMLTGHLERAAATRPVLMIFEDAHWADSTSLELLGVMLGRVAGLRVMIVITHRPEFVPPWEEATALSKVTLDRLDRRAGTLIVQRVTHGRVLPPVVLEDILARTDGVPLFIEELTSSILESGLLRETPAGFELTGAFSTLAVPRSLNASLLARLDRLASVKAIAQTGAAIGREFGYRLLAEVAALPRAQLDDALARLVASGLVLERTEEGGRTFSFKHALVQEVAYSTLLRSRRLALHAQIADAMQALVPEIVANQPEILARHLAEAGLSERAVMAYQRAGRLALSRSADREASSHLRRGLDLLAALPLGKARDHLELALLTSFGIALSAAKGYGDDGAVSAFERARALVHRLESREDIGSVFNGLFILYSNRAEFPKALEVAKEFMALTEGSSDPITRSTAYRMVAVTHRLMGEIAISRPFCERALELAPDLADVKQVWRLTHDPGIAARYNLAVILWHSGEVELSLAMERDALLRAERIRHGSTLGFALAYIGCMSAYRRRDFASLERLCARLIEHARSYRSPMWEAMGRVYRGRVQVERGRAAAGIEDLEHAIAAFDRMQIRFHKPLYLGMLAEGHLAQDRAADALAVLEQAIALGDQTGERSHSAELWRLRAQAAWSSGSSDARSTCEHDLRLAIDIARVQGSIMFERRAASDLTRLQAAAGANELRWADRQLL